MTFKQIKKDYNNGEYQYHEKILPTYKKDYIFDENLTIRQNREMVEKANQDAKLQKQRICCEQNKLDERLIKDLVEAIVCEYGSHFYYSTLMMFVNKIYSEYHSNMTDFFWHVEEDFDFILNLFQNEQEEKKKYESLN